MEKLSVIFLQVANVVTSNKYKLRCKQTLSCPNVNVEKNQLANDFIFLINIQVTTGFSHK